MAATASGVPSLAAPILPPPIWVKDEGFTALTDPKSPVADVIFIHGLQGNPRRTWRYKGMIEKQVWVEEKDEKGPSISRRLWKSKKAVTRKGNWQTRSDESSIFWPADLMPLDHPDVRILTYGYDSRVTKYFGGAVNQNNLDNYGRDFLIGLEAVRRTCPNRPLIFVAHSLGGLLVKEALRRSRDERHQLHLKTIYESVRSIMFFGTPHRGSPDGGWGSIFRGIANVAMFDTNPQILRDLDSSSTTGKLDSLNEAFCDILLEKDIMITTFQEAQGKAGTSLLALNSKVVPDFSSALDDRKHEIKESVNASHMDMCRFWSRDDPGYTKFRNAFSLHINAVNRGNSQAVKECMQSLYFDEINYRSIEIAEAESSTFQWILDPNKSDLVNWLKEGRQIFWICGKPGSGKSTMMKFLQNSSAVLDILDGGRDGPGWTIVTFYFTFKGTKLEKTLEGLLRSFLLQLLMGVPELGDLIKGYGFVESNLGPTFSWDMKTLENAFTHAMLSNKAKVCLFVDALDEFEGSMPALISLLKRLEQGGKIAQSSIRVCVASRPHANILLELEKSPGLRMENCNREDILNFVQQRLAPLLCSHLDELDIPRFSSNIVEKADGVFLWASFAVKDLIEGFSYGDTERDLERRLEEIPPDVEDVYRRILRNVNPRYRLELMVMLQVICYANAILNIDQFRCAVSSALASIEEDSLTSCITDSLTTSSRLQFIRRTKTISGGLLDIVKVGETDYEMKLLHKTVKSFLDLPDWNRDIISDLQPRLVMDGHETLLKSCAIYSRQAYKDFDIVEVPDNVRPAKFTRERWPFLQYSRSNLPHHARLSEARTGVSCRILLDQVFKQEEYQLPSFEYYYSSKGINYDDHPEEVTELELAAGHGLLLYCKELIERVVDVNCGGGRAIRAAALSSNTKILRALLSAGALLDREHPYALQAIVIAARYRDLEMMKILVDNGTDVDFISLDGTSALYTAVVNVNVPAIDYLLMTGANPNLGTSQDGRNALHWAILSEKQEVVNLLIQYGADVNADGCDLGSPLQIAINLRNRAIIKRLLAVGADPTQRGGRYGSPFHAAMLDVNQETATLIWEAMVMRESEVTPERLAAYKESNVWIDFDTIQQISQSSNICAGYRMYHNGTFDNFLARKLKLEE